MTSTLTEPAATDRSPLARPLGIVYLPKSGTGVGSYQFLVAEDALDVAIDTPVSADTDEGTVVGVVTDMTTVGSMTDPFNAAFLADDENRNPLADVNDAVKVATVQVYHSPALRPISGTATVRSATAEEITLATGGHRMEVQVPAGVVELAHGEFARVPLDGHTLLGPESAHLTIGGLSGQASKTSYAGVLLRSAMHACAENGESMSAIVFNVKGEDLVNLHLPPAAGYELTDDDRRIYAAMGVPATPFEDVVVYAPALPGGLGTRSSREDALPLQWDLRTIWPYLKYFSPGLYSNENMSALLGDIASAKLYTDNPSESLATFNRLQAWLEGEIADADSANQPTIWRNHHIATARRALKLILSLPGRTGGLLTKDSAAAGADVPVEQLRDGQVLVVDIAGLEPLVQSAVIARTCERLLQTSERDGLAVDHVVVFADELNMFAPATGGDMDAVRRILTKISATGRYAGISLWGAAQFVSQVSPQVVGNAATKAAGILSDSEVDSGVFGRLAAGQRERIVTLPKGYMSVKAYNLRGMLTIRFPRPAWQTGKPKGPAARKRTTVTDTLGLRQESLARLTEGIPAEVVERSIADADGDVTAAIAKLERARTPDMQHVSVERSSTFDETNPWGIE